MIQIKPSCSLQDLSPLQCPGEEVRLNLPMLMPTYKRWFCKFKLEGLSRVCWVGSSSPLLTQVYQNPLALHLLCSCRSETGASYLALQNYPQEGDPGPSAWHSDQHFCSESRVPMGLHTCFWSVVIHQFFLRQVKRVQHFFKYVIQKPGLLAFSKKVYSDC